MDFIPDLDFQQTLFLFYIGKYRLILQYGLFSRLQFSANYIAFLYRGIEIGFNAQFIFPT